jgi:MFS family permease
VGPVIADAMVRRGIPGEHAARVAVWTYFVGVAMLSGVGHWAALLVATLAWGMGGGGNWVLSSAAIQRLSPESYVGRLSAIDNLAWTTAMCLAALGGAALVDRTGVHGASAWLGLAVGAGAWIGVRWTIARRQAKAKTAERLTRLHREASDTLSPPRSS